MREELARSVVHKGHIINVYRMVSRRGLTVGYSYSTDLMQFESGKVSVANAENAAKDAIDERLKDGQDT